MMAGTATASPETAAFWEAAREGRFLVRVCSLCERTHWYPRAICPFCASSDTQWRAGAGRGTIYSYSVMRRADPPYAIGFVTLEEGCTMMTSLVQCDLDALTIGQAVTLVFIDSAEGARLPAFTPDRSTGHILPAPRNRSQGPSLTD